jgi:hypothetical protein
MPGGAARARSSKLRAAPRAPGGRPVAWPSPSGPGVGAALLLVALLCGLPALRAQDPRGADAPQAEATRAAIRDGVAFLLRSANPDGSFGGPRNKTMTDLFANAETHRSWTAATTGLVVAALLEAHEASPDPAIPPAVRKALGALARWDPMKRPADWDIDNVWGQIYGLLGLARALRAPGLQADPGRPAWESAARSCILALRRYQSPRGGYGYYADADSAWRPEWATTFTTAAAVVAMVEAREAGLLVDSATLARAVAAVRRGRLPSGAYTYDVMTIPRRRGIESIDDLRGSLGRIQVCTYARLRAGDRISEEERRAALDLLVREHVWLDCAFRRPVPHEAWYANAAYFYLFAHYYAALVQETLPASDRDRWQGPLRAFVLKARVADGSFWDFYISDHTKPYGTAFAIMTLLRTLPVDA